MIIKQIAALSSLTLIFSVSSLVFAHGNDTGHRGWHGPMTFSPFYSSSGSSGSSSPSNCKARECDKNALDTEEETSVFLKQTLDYLPEEIARGEGDRLKALAGLIGCSEDNLSAFSLLLKTNYQVLYSERPSNISADNSKFLLNRLQKILLSDPVLHNKCTVPQNTAFISKQVLTL
ncbi:MAG: DUF3015 family protein [SAR324 cluster bacterium]|nr:DUF3015 family protein [SAR324 cluster bacterium]MBL7034741.1 DUF3015 family protein [SAR324 cluster bacterium]